MASTHGLADNASVLLQDPKAHHGWPASDEHAYTWAPCEGSVQLQAAGRP